MKTIAVLAAALLAVLWPTPVGAQDNEAEKLFRGMEKKLIEAKAYEVTFDYQVGKRQATGALLMAQGNKMRLKITGHFDDKPKASFVVVSDGAQIRSKGVKFSVASNGQPGMELGGQSEWKTPAHFQALVTSISSRGGMWFSTLMFSYLDERAGGLGTDLDGEESKMKVYDFKLVGADKLGDRDAKVIRYRFGSGGGCRFDEEITLWLDAKTLLPLKRSFTLKVHDLRIVEHYRDFSLAPKVDGKAFELPN